MPFGLKNAPRTFQRVIDVILYQVKWKYALVYLDDVIVFNKSVQQHIEHVLTVLSLLKDGDVSFELNECSLFTDQVE